MRQITLTPSVVPYILFKLFSTVCIVIYCVYFFQDKFTHVFRLNFMVDLLVEKACLHTSEKCKVLMIFI